MKKNVLEYLEDTVKKYPDRCAYRDIETCLSFAEVARLARQAGSRIGRYRKPGRPIAVLMEKSPAMIVAFLGVVYGGCCYCPIDKDMPKERLKILLSELDPAALIAGPAQMELAESLGLACDCLEFSALCRTKEDALLLEQIRREAVDTDPLYVLFTSGSTGIPKGVAASHRMIINNMEWLEEEYDFGPEDIFGNQAPLHFDIANHDIYGPLKFGCCTVLIPPEYFVFPAKLTPFLKKEKITSVFWVPFALCMAADLKALEVAVPDKLRYVFFAGEAMPVKQLNCWRRHVPGARYVNMYGSTETHVCLYYNLDREFGEGETLPIGRPCGNVGALLLDEKGEPVEPESGKEGELCIRGGALSLGYYRNKERTGERFIQNPCRPDVPEKIYRTGDLARYNERGELEYLGRTDFQIKHLGYRIEPGEIEAAAEGIPGILSCACCYDKKRRKLVLFYTGEAVERAVITRRLSEKLPRYMLPGRFCYLEAMPRNPNGKIDRKQLEKLLQPAEKQ